jgi:hypothetical protein
LGQDRPCQPGTLTLVAFSKFEMMSCDGTVPSKFAFRFTLSSGGPVTFTMIVLAPLGVKLIPLAISRELAEILTMSVDPARSIELEVVLVAGIDRAVRG